MIRIDWAGVGLLVVIFVPRLLSPAVFLTADEPLFLDHARKFAAGLVGGDLARTLGIGYPGVTVAWWSAPVVAGAPTDLAGYAAGRLVTAMVTGLLLVAIYRLSRRLLGRRPALLGVGLLALDPYTLAYSRLFHIEAVLALLMTLAGLAALLWLRDTSRRWLILAGLCTGLALLTKSTALLLAPMLAAAMLAWRLAEGRRVAGLQSCRIAGLQGCKRAGGQGDYVSVYSLPMERSTHHAIRSTLHVSSALLLIFLIAAVVFVALWPAVWVQPGRAISLTLGKLLTDQEAGAGNLGMFWLGRFVEDPGPAFYPVAFILKATPWLLLGLALSLSSLRPGRRPASWPAVVALWLFALVYLLLMTIASKKSIRYLLPAFPTFYLLAGVALEGWRIGGLEGWRVGRFLQPLAGFVLAGVPRWLQPRALQAFNDDQIPRVPENRIPPPSIFHLPSLHPSILPSLLLFLFTLFYHPYYFTYYNPLVLGWRWAPQTVLVGWGEGLDEAARYLAGRAGGPVAAWYDWLFRLFYTGETEPVVPPENLVTAGAVVLYVNQVQRNIPDPNLIAYFRNRRRPAYTVNLAGVEYAWVYPGPIAGPRSAPVTPMVPLGGTFGGQAQLLGYDLAGPARSGEPLVVTLYWQPLAVPPADWYVYARLVDERGHIWAKTDSPPVMGFWPTTRWQPGTIVEDAQVIEIPAGTPPGAYRLEVGLYDHNSGQVITVAGQPAGQGGGLLLGEVPVEWQALAGENDLPGAANARLAPNAALVGYDPPPAAATTGDLIQVHLAWREAAGLFSWTAEPNDYVLFSWRPAAGPAKTDPLPGQLDPLPWPIERWGRGALLRSQHDVVVPAGLAAGRYDLEVSLHTGSDPAGPAFSLGQVDVVAPPHAFDLPAAARPPAGPGQLAQAISLAGYEYQATAADLRLTLYWRAAADVTSRYKVFAQLLDAGQTLVAQSDAVPAAGQRPTTGWLPGEIIADPHTLALPAGLPPGTYRLIAGLYDPLTGQRLPIVPTAHFGSALADAIFVAEVTLP